MREIRTSGLMSGDGKRSVATQGPSYRARPRLYDGLVRCPLDLPNLVALSARYASRQSPITASAAGEIGTHRFSFGKPLDLLDNFHRRLAQSQLIWGIRVKNDFTKKRR